MIKLQVLPAEPHWPRPPTGLGSDGPHPCVLEARVRTSTTTLDTYVGEDRATAVLTLTALLRNQLWFPEQRGAGWIVEGDDHALRWGLLGYFPRGFQLQTSSFSPTNEVPPIREVSAQDFYGTAEITHNEFVVPDALGDLLRRFRDLPPGSPRRLAFLTACHWYCTSRSASQSLRIVSLMSAIEALLPEATTACTDCGARLPSIAHRVTVFLHNLLPDLDDTTTKRLKDLYGDRSRIVHGAELWGQDHPTNSDIGSSPRGVREHNQDRLAAGVVPLIIVNWLVAQSAGD